MGLRSRLRSLSKVHRPAIDSPLVAWEVRPTRLRAHFFPPALVPFVLSMQSFRVGSRGGEGLTAGVHGAMIAVVEPEPWPVARFVGERVGEPPHQAPQLIFPSTGSDPIL